MTDQPPMVCERCGRPHGKCAAHNKAGGPCGRARMKGQLVCYKHGGNSSQAKRKAAERMQNALAEEAVATFGLPIDIDHHTALLQELHRTVGAVAWLGQQVAALDAGDVVWGRTREKVGGEDEGTTHEAGVNVWVRLWQGERRHLLDVTKACHGAGIDERRMQLAEAAGEQLATVLRAVFARLVLSEEQWDLVAVVVPEELRAIAALTGGSSASGEEAS